MKMKPTQIDFERMTTQACEIVKKQSIKQRKEFIDYINKKIENNTILNENDENIIKMSFLYTAILGSLGSNISTNKNSKILFDMVTSRGHCFVLKK